MTMVEIRKELKVMKNFAKCNGHFEMVAYYSVMAECFECLYKNLRVSYYPQEFLSVANGYQIITGNYKTFHIAQTHDLHTISCDSKAVARDFFQCWVFELI